MLGYIARMPEARALGVFDKPERDRRRRGRAAADRLRRRRLQLLRGGGLRQHERHRRLDRRRWRWPAWAIVLNVAAIVFMVPLGLATGAAVLVGRAYGARDRPA